MLTFLTFHSGRPGDVTESVARGTSAERDTHRAHPVATADNCRLCAEGKNATVTSILAEPSGLDVVMRQRQHDLIAMINNRDVIIVMRSSADCAITAAKGRPG